MFSRFTLNASLLASWGLIITALLLRDDHMAVAGLVSMIVSYGVGSYIHGSESQSFISLKKMIEQRLKASEDKIDLYLSVHDSSMKTKIESFGRTEGRASELIAQLKAIGEKPW